MSTYQFTLTGRSAILMHADDVMASDMVRAWQKDPANKGMSVAGDDRSPPWVWQTYLYTDEEKTKLAMPSANIMSCLAAAGSRINLSKGKGTFKRVSQSGIIIDGEHCTFLSRGKEVPFAPIAAISGLDFKEQFDAVKKMGFELLVKRAAVDKKKHVRVRARFNVWKVIGTCSVTDPIITPQVLGQLFELGGKYVGLCDWRPGSPSSPGSFGMFKSELKPA